MLRRVMIGAALAAGLLVIAAFAVVAFRIPLAEALLSSQLASLGVPATRLTVSSLDVRRLVVTDIALGDGGELQADSVTVTYSPKELLSGRVAQAAIDGVRLRLDLTGAGPPLGSLQTLVPDGAAERPGDGDGAGAAAPLPAAVILSRGRIEAVLPSGEVAATVSGQWQPLAGTATLAVGDVALPHVVLDDAGLEVEVTADRIAVTGQARGPQEALDIDLHATVDSWRRQPMLKLALEGTLDAAAWRSPPVPGVATGTAALALQLEGRLQPLPARWVEADALPWLLGSELRGRLQGSAGDVTWDDGAHGISGTLDLAATVADGELSIAMADDSRVGIARLAAAIVDASGLAAIAPGLIDGAVTATVPFASGPTFRLRSHPDGATLAVSGGVEVALADNAMELHADGTLSLDSGLAVERVSFPRIELGFHNLTLVGGHRLRWLQLTGAIGGQLDDLSGTADLTAALAAARFAELAVGDSRVALAADISWTHRRLEIRQRGTGTASLASVVLGAQAQLAKPLAVRLADGALAVDLAPDGVRLTHRVTVRPEPVNVDLTRVDGPPVVLHAAAGPVRLAGGFEPGAPYRGRLTLGASSLAMPELAFAAEAITASLAFPAVAGERLARFSVGRVAHAADPAYLAPLRIDGEVTRQTDAYEMAAAGTGADGGLRITARARHRVADGRGTLRLDVPEIAFEKKGLQPARLSPLLGDLRSATGRIAASGEFAWGPGGLESKGTLDLSEISFVAGDMPVAGLGARISLAGLLPPATPPGQEITVRQIDPALPLDDVAVTFQAEPAWPPRLRISGAGAKFVGGRLGVGPTLVDLSHPKQEFDLAVDGVDLGLLLTLLKVDDVSATGRLAGTIPVTIADGTAFVGNGQLAADGPGVLRVKSEAARAALGGAGESVALMLSALEDFRYQSLAATLNMGAGGNISVMTRMQGHNPAVLDGYPFAFNIGLDGKLSELLVALRRGARLSTDLVRPRLR